MDNPLTGPYHWYLQKQIFPEAHSVTRDCDMESEEAAVDQRGKD